MLTCPNCGQQNPAESRFCNACATPLAVAAPEDAREERKVVSVLFCDLVGFTARSERLDPEDVRALLAPYHGRLRAELERFGGTVEKFIGDAVVGLFGAPVAHEDDAERAVRAALAIRDWVLEEGGIQVRIGVNTGEALVRLDAKPHEGEGMATGDVVNTAARLQTAAPVMGILVGERTYLATAQEIEYRLSDPVVAKGKEDPVAAYEAVEARSRYGVDLSERVAGPFVGRERELDLLGTTLRRVVAERSPQLLTLVGVPGIGKSRLLREFFVAVDADPDTIVLWRQGRCLPYGDGVTFWALGEMLKAQSGVLESDEPADVERKLDSAVRAVIPDETDAKWIASTLRPLLGLEREMDLTADRLDQSFAAWRRFLEALAESYPLVLVFEDLHWADEAMLEFIDQLVDWATGVPLLVVGSSRPELLDRRPNWGGGKTNAVTVSLSPLADGDTAELVTSLLDADALGSSSREDILAKAGGNPLYAEQYARMLSERGAMEELPGSIQGIIAARLDSLDGEEKATLQVASVAGKVFWLGAIEAMGGPPATQSAKLLHGLERKGFVRRARKSSVAGETEYAFQHILLRDVAYSQIPRATRSKNHRAAADWLESLGRREDHAEMLAYHYGQALEYLLAVGDDDPELADRVRLALAAAAERALSLGGYANAVASFQRSLELTSEDDPGRGELLLAYGRAQFLADGTGTDLLRQAVDRLEAEGAPERAAAAAVELARATFFRGERAQTDDAVERALALTENAPESAARARALVAKTAYEMLGGQYLAAIETGRSTLPLVESLGLEPERARLLDVIGVSRALTADAGGLADSALAIEVARESGDMFELIVSINNLMNGQLALGQIDASRESLERFREAVERYGTVNNRRWLASNLSEDFYLLGRWDEAMSLLDEDIARTDRGFPFYLDAMNRSRRGVIREARGDLQGALADTERAIELARTARDHQLLGPVLVMRGNILHAAGKSAEAERLLNEVLDLGEGAVAFLQQDAMADSLMDVAWLAYDLRREERLRSVLETTVENTWAEPALAILRGDAASTGDMLERLRSDAAAAYARHHGGLQLIAKGRTDEGQTLLQKALEFYRKAGATKYLREAEEALGTSGAITAERSRSAEA
ncbi:MAG: AAA family ATPase [Actinomycetota bacterium]